MFCNNIKMCDCPEVFQGSAVASATAPVSGLNSNVQSTASATATSTISQEVANALAQQTANQVAQSNANSEANVISQTVTVLQQNGLIGGGSGGGSSNFQAVVATGSTYTLPTPGSTDPKVMQIINGNPQAYQALNDLGFDKGAISVIYYFKGYLYVGLQTSYIETNLIDFKTSTYCIIAYNLSTNSWVSLPNGGLYNYGNTGEIQVNSIISYNDTSLYIGGKFDGTLDKTNELKCIAAFTPGTNGDPSTGTWNVVKDANNNKLYYSTSLTEFVVNCITVVGSNLYIGGKLSGTTGGSGSITSNYIIAYTPGSSASVPGTWYAVKDSTSNQLDNAVNCITVVSSNLYIGGNLTGTTDGSTVSITSKYIIAYTPGSSASVPGTWYAVKDSTSNQLDNAVNCITVVSSNLYIGGKFTVASGGSGGSITSYYIIKYTPGSTINLSGTWTAVKDTNSNQLYYSDNNYASVKCITVVGNNLYIGGVFTRAINYNSDIITNYITSNNIILFNYSNSTWQALQNNGLIGDFSNVSCIYNYNNILYFGGNFTKTATSVSLNGNVSNINRICTYDPTITNQSLTLTYNNNTLLLGYPSNTITLYYSNSKWNLLY